MKSPFLMLTIAQINRIRARTSRRVFDSTPENEIFPYIVMGALLGLPWTDKFVPGQEVYSTIHIWSQYPGKTEVLMIGDEVLRALTWQPLNLGSEFHAVVEKMDEHQVIPDVDGFTRHGILSFKYLIEEAC